MRWPAGDCPLDGSAQHAGAHVEDALVVQQLAVAQVERFVVDEQPDELAVGDVDDCLARLREAVARLGVGQRSHLVERVQVGAHQAGGIALVEIAAHPDVPVGQREQ